MIFGKVLGILLIVLALMCVQLLGELYIYIYSKLRKVSSRLLHTRKARSFFISVSACNSGQQQQCGSLGLRQLALISGSIDMTGFENHKTIREV